MAINDSVNELAPLALAIVSLAIIVGIGSVVLTQMQDTSYDTVTVTDEASSPATPLPTNFTVSVASDADFHKVVETSETIVFYDSSAGTNTTLTRDTDYNTYYDVGKFGVLSTTATSDYNATEDKIFRDYDYEKEGTAYAVLGSGIDTMTTFSDFFTVIVVIGIAAVLFLLLSVVKRNGRSTMA